MRVTQMDDLKLPKMRMIEQRLNVLPPVNVPEEIDREWNRLINSLVLSPGLKVAVAVGSRGIADLCTVVLSIIQKLKEAGCKPFVIPAMGSHGGAIAEGQIEVLRMRGITEGSVGAPVRATMDVETMGDIDGIPLFIDRLAHEADGIVLINRIKPHTNFIGATESGIIKMMAIGLGNQVGAEHYHRLSLVRDQYTIINSAGKELLKRCNVLFGVALVENQKQELTEIKMGLADEIEAVESNLLKIVRDEMPRLPLDEIDFLIIDEMGKDISGEGIDPNVVGRDVCAYGVQRPWPKITRIFVRDLTDASEGSALGIGQADFTTQRLVSKINFQVTAINCLTACCPESGKIPLTYPNDRQAIDAALMTLRPYTLADLRIVHIKSTLDLKRLLVSHACLDDLKEMIDLIVGEEDLNLEFEDTGNLMSRLTTFH